MHDGRLTLVDDIWLLEAAPFRLTPEMVRARQQRELTILNDPQFVKRMKRHITAAQRDYKRMQDVLWYELQGFFHRWLQDLLTDSELLQSTSEMLRQAFRRAYRLGLQASTWRGETGSAPRITSAEQSWLNNAINTELRYWQRFVRQFTTRSLGGTRWPDRIKAYIHTMDRVFQRGRVCGMADDVLVYWIGPHDHATCASCHYLFKHSPYSKSTLPTVPRAGATKCRWHCRDNLLVRNITPEELQRYQAKKPLSRKAHIKNLTRLMQNSTQYLNGRITRNKDYRPRKTPAPVWTGSAANFLA